MRSQALSRTPSRRSARPRAIFLAATFLALMLAIILAQRSAIYQARPGSARVAAHVPAIPDALRFVDGLGTPLADTTIWVLCYGDPEATNYLDQTLVSTDSAGMPTQPLPSNCPYVAALQRVHSQPSGKAGHGPAYLVYAASWRTGSGTPDFDMPGCSYGVANCALARPSSGDIVIRRAWPLVLFRVVVSLEWTPPPHSDYATQVRKGLAHASAYLADLTDGYMAIGAVSIHSGGRMWSSADLRFHAANDLRPAAFIGGVIDTTRLYTAATDEAAIFRPAATFMGRYWDGTDAFQGTWDAPDGYRTLVHEWAHYALFLYDEYGERSLRTGGTVPAFCTCDQLPQLLNPSINAVCTDVTRANGASAMAFHYVASELWHPVHGSPVSCNVSDQARFHGEPDWRTLANWYILQGLGGNADLTPLGPPTAPLPGPDALVMDGPLADLFAQQDAYTLRLPLLTLSAPLPPPTPVYSSTLRVQIADSAADKASLVPQVYLLQQDARGRAGHLLYEGTLTGMPDATALGQIGLVGITPDDSLRVFVDRYKTSSVEGARFIYESPPNDAVQNLQLVTAEMNSWQSSLDLVYSTTVAAGDTPGLLAGLTAVLSGPHNSDFGQAPQAQICVPDAEIGCPAAWLKTMQLDANGRWLAHFAPLAGEDELPLYGVIRIISPQMRADQLMRWFRDAGGVGPGHKIGNSAPLRDGLVMVDRVDAPLVEAECNRVMIMPAANYTALQLPLDAAALVSAPLDIDIILGAATNGECVAPPGSGAEEFPALRLTLFYSEDAIARLGIGDETQLYIMQLSPAGEEWVQLTTLVDPDLNRATARIVEDGIYAIGWQ